MAQPALGVVNCRDPNRETRFRRSLLSRQKPTRQPGERRHDSDTKYCLREIANSSYLLTVVLFCWQCSIATHLTTLNMTSKRYNPSHTG